MFYYLNGVVAAAEVNLLVIDCGGVGFSVHTTTNTISRIRVGEMAKLFTCCSIREDAFDIYGFALKQELEAFQLLISVTGVGPKAALAILSSVTPDGLQMAVATQDEKILTSAPGVGKKIAQRILLELKDKMGAVTELNVSGRDMTVLPVGPGDKATEAVQALQVLGYDTGSITKAMKQIDVEKLELQDVIKQALRLMTE